MSLQSLFTIAMSLIMGFSCAHFARRRGRNPKTWFLIGLFFGIFGLIALFLFPLRRPQPAQARDPAPAPKLTAISPDHAEKLWYFLDEHKTQFGPMSIDALSREWRDGKVNEQTYVWNETMENWARVQEVLKPI